MSPKKMKPGELPQHVNMYVTREELERIRELAQKDNRSMSSWLRLQVLPLIQRRAK